VHWTIVFNHKYKGGKMHTFNFSERVVTTKILSSSHVNFLFGAGVNGKTIPQMKEMSKTKALLQKALGREIINFENDLNEIKSQKIKKKISVTFIKELTEAIGNVGRSLKDSNDIRDIEKLFLSVNNLIIQTENRNITMKQVNIYTTNYDSIVDDCLDRTGLLFNVISSSNYSNHDKFFEMIGYDYRKKKYVPTYLVSKIHGDLRDPILPYVEKYDETLQSKRFEILFNMKGQLSRPNSVLFVIGYSGKDKHINSLLRDCVSFGLTVYWFRFDNDEPLPQDLINQMIVIDQKDNSNKQNTTISCKELIEGICQEQLEE